MDGAPGQQVATASPSSCGLDGVNLFVAAVQTGFGSYVTVYLVKNQWPPNAVGFALTTATLCSLASQIPLAPRSTVAREARGRAAWHRRRGTCGFAVGRQQSPTRIYLALAVKAWRVH